MVGADGFEPPTSWSQTRRSTRLSYAPTQREEIRGHYEVCQSFLSSFSGILERKPIAGVPVAVCGGSPEFGGARLPLCAGRDILERLGTNFMAKKPDFEQR